MITDDFLKIWGRHSLFLTNNEDLAGGEDEAIRSGGQGTVAVGGAAVTSDESADDAKTDAGGGAAMEDTSGGVALGEATGNSSSAETGLGTLAEAPSEEKGR